MGDLETSGTALRFCVIGAGSMGSLYGGLLARAGFDVTLVDVWDEHIDAIRREGLQLDGITGDVVSRSSAVRAAEVPPADVPSCSRTPTRPARLPAPPGAAPSRRVRRDAPERHRERGGARRSARTDSGHRRTLVSQRGPPGARPRDPHSRGADLDRRAGRAGRPARTPRDRPRGRRVHTRGRRRHPRSHLGQVRPQLRDQRDQRGDRPARAREFSQPPGRTSCRRASSTRCSRSSGRRGSSSPNTIRWGRSRTTAA